MGVAEVVRRLAEQATDDAGQQEQAPGIGRRLVAFEQGEQVVLNLDQLRKDLRQWALLVGRGQGGDVVMDLVHALAREVRLCGEGELPGAIGGHFEHLPVVERDRPCDR